MNENPFTLKRSFNLLVNTQKFTQNNPIIFRSSKSDNVMVSIPIEITQSVQDALERGVLAITIKNLKML